MRTVVFKFITPRVVVIPYRRFGANYVSSSRMKFSSPLKMRQIGCPETSVRNYHYARRVIAQKSAVLTLGQVSPFIIFLTGDFGKTFGTSKLHLFHVSFYKIPNLKDCVGGGKKPIC